MIRAPNRNWRKGKKQKCAIRSDERLDAFSPFLPTAHERLLVRNGEQLTKVGGKPIIK
jgi:hypothetical protein